MVYALSILVGEGPNCGNIVLPPEIPPWDTEINVVRGDNQ